MISRVVTLCFFMFVYFAYGQEINSPLITINNEKIASEEFSRIYQKNLSLVDEKDKTGLEDYLETFINYKLKVLEARRQGFHKKESYQKELQGYRLKLVENYMTDTQASEQLLQEAYKRLKNEINASHILVRVSAEASPIDTLYAYNKIQELYALATPSNFDSLRKTVHDGKTFFGEELGYFSVFKMVYPFESVAYNTSPETLSKPFRTRFGYHFLKINAQRLNRGETEVSHIMILHAKDSSKNDQAKKRIEDIYQRLQNGGSFETLAKQFSEDKGSAIKGGRLPKFMAGRLSSKVFEDIAFTISENEISTPFETKFGWHIIKGIKQYPIGSFEEEKGNLKAKLKKDQRSKMVTTSFLNKLKKNYNFKVDEAVRDEIIGMVDDNFYKRQWVYDKNSPVLEKQLFRIRDTIWKAKTFASWLRQEQFKIRNDFGTINFKNLFNDFSKKELLKYHEANLENENKEFSAILNEYREGLLLFDIMQEEIWDEARMDSTGLRDFYEKNKNQYRWEQRVELITASYTNVKATPVLKGLMLNETNLETLRKLAKNLPELKDVIFTAIIMDLDDYRLPERYKPSMKWFEKKDDAGLTLFRTIALLPSQEKSYEEAKGSVINDYQNFLEEKWIRSLRDSNKIKINKKELRMLKKKLKVK
ncbi:peptidylprolyl isomerase [Ascidiimonas sp. W6]|uniref:peptidylprolyl isomerase n=1 Tax=Ascidiimonas meishanensis TaxID=3128903 RepID=UPI0030EEDB98